MDKLYSKTALVIKGVLCALLSPMLFLVAYVTNIEDSFLFVVIPFIIVGCLFSIPFWMTIFQIKLYYTGKVGKYIALDALSCVVPSILGILFTEIAYTFIIQNADTTGFVTIIYTFIFLLIAAIFWVMYYVFSKK